MIPPKKHMWLMEIASNFGMDSSGLIEYMGYSRQAVYQAACGMTKLAERRLAVALYKLEILNEKLHEDEISKAEENYKKRSKMIDILGDRLGS